MISGRISKLVSKVTAFFTRKPKTQARQISELPNPPAFAPPRHVPLGAIRGQAHRRAGAKRGQRLQRRALRRKLARLSHLLPPPSGQRRAEFSSSVAGQWTRALMLVLALLLPSLASAQSISSQLDNGGAGVSRPSVHDAERTPLSPRITIIAGNAADAISTEVMLQRGGVHEGNAIMSQRMTQRLALKAAGTAAQVWIVGRLGKEHPRLAKVVGYSAGAFFGGVTLWNSTR